MAAKQLSEVAKDVLVGEDSDVAYARLYGDQIKPCDFRRWFAQVTLHGTSNEVSEEVLESLKLYVAEKMTVDEAFKTHVPDYIGPGEFLTAYGREMKARKTPTEQPSQVPASDRKSGKKRPDPVIEDTVLPEGVTLI